MNIVKDFNINIDKDGVFRAVSSYYPLSTDTSIDKIYYNLEQTAINTVRPLGIFKLDKMPDNKPCNLLKSCEFIIYCIFTLGDDITEETDKLFSENEFVNGLILDAISTSILFDISRQFYDRIYEFTALRNLGLTCRIAPGDGEIDITYQKHIIENLEGYKDFGIELVHDYMVKPYKSITYIFGADKSIKLNKQDHKCENCLNSNCFMRNSKERIRGPYVV